MGEESVSTTSGSMPGMSTRRAKAPLKSPVDEIEQRLRKDRRAHQTKLAKSIDVTKSNINQVGNGDNSEDNEVIP